LPLETSRHRRSFTRLLLFPVALLGRIGHLNEFNG
jgi:hypothetical protein